jgi:hypothetical protein
MKISFEKSVLGFVINVLVVLGGSSFHALNNKTMDSLLLDRDFLICTIHYFIDRCNVIKSQLRAKKLLKNLYDSRQLLLSIIQYIQPHFIKRIKN